MELGMESCPYNSLSGCPWVPHPFWTPVLHISRAQSILEITETSVKELAAQTASFDCQLPPSTSNCCCLLPTGEKQKQYSPKKKERPWGKHLLQSFSSMIKCQVRVGLKDPRSGFIFLMEKTIRVLRKQTRDAFPRDPKISPLWTGPHQKA